jgi:hypothetical protein
MNSSPLSVSLSCSTSSNCDHVSFTTGVVNAVIAMVVYVIPDEPPQMLFVQRDDMVEISRRQLPTQRSAIPFCQGALTLVRFGCKPVAFRKVITSALNFESWSKITYRYGPASENASRSCCTTQSEVG